jgi:S1-C subfamily serine protease
MKPSMRQWLVIVLLAGANVTAHAQQGSPNNPNQNGQQQNQNQGGQPPSQNGQQQNQSRQAPSSKPSNNQTWFVPHGSINTQFQPNNLYSTVFQNWASTGNGVAWASFTDLNAEMSLTPADDALRTQLGLNGDQGLIVAALAANAPASQAGIEQNDVLLELGDHSLGKSEDLEEGLKAAEEKPISLTILRAGKRLRIQVQPRVRVALGPVQADSPAFWIGVSVSPLEPALRAQLKLPQSHGLLAIDVVKDSPAAQADIKVHDILLSLDGNMLDSQEKLVELVQSNGEKTVPLELIRAGKKQTLAVTPQRRKPAPFGSKRTTRDKLFSYQVVRPGAVVNLNTNAVWLDDAMKAQIGTALAQPSAEQQPEASFTPSTKRLDELDSEMKQLRKAIEELNKILKDKK